MLDLVALGLGGDELRRPGGGDERGGHRSGHRSEVGVCLHDGHRRICDNLRHLDGKIGICILFLYLEFFILFLLLESSCFLSVVLRFPYQHIVFRLNGINFCLLNGRDHGR